MINKGIDLQEIIQPNAVTNARYEYSQIEKDVMYHYIERMMLHMTKEKLLGKDLFGNYVIEFDLRDITNKNNHAQVLAALRSLQRKPISYNLNRPDGVYDITTTLIASVIHKRNSSLIQVKTTEESLPVVTYLGQGFTALNKSVALSLPSVHAKRMYELCCRWRDTGFYRVSIKEFRKMMAIEDKYKNASDLRSNVLDMADRFLRERADLFFTYVLRKEKGRAYDWLEISIYSKDVEDRSKIAGYYQWVYAFTYGYLRDSRAFNIVEWLCNNKLLKKTYNRLHRLEKDINSGRILPHGILGYFIAVLTSEFGVPVGMVGEKSKRAKTGKKRAKTGNIAVAGRKAKNIVDKKAVKSVGEIVAGRSVRDLLDGMDVLF